MFKIGDKVRHTNIKGFRGIVASITNGAGVFVQEIGSLEEPILFTKRHLVLWNALTPDEIFIRLLKRS